MFADPNEMQNFSVSKKKPLMFRSKAQTAMALWITVLVGATTNLADAQSLALRSSDAMSPIGATKLKPVVATTQVSAKSNADALMNGNGATVRVLLDPDVETVLLAQMVGRIVKLNGDLGRRVVKGELLVGMDCSESLAKLTMSQAELASASETYNSKVRLKKLDAAGDIEVSLAAAAVSRADGQIAMTQAQIQNCSVHAPFSGRIARMHVKPHQGVNAGQTLLELVSDGPPRLRLNVSSKWLRTIKVGTPFEVEIEETGKTYEAAVSAINGRVDAVAQTIEVEARLSRPYKTLLAGMSGTARFSFSP
jgi:membrane fusion protein, multidrug efflux system